ncbi:Protein sidekick-2 [Aix galericulata]|nr:Protein sidekick-2 [Aix galericulata]
MPDWISGEEGWAFFFFPPPLYLGALPLRGGSGAEPARPHGDQLGGGAPAGGHVVVPGAGNALGRAERGLGDAGSRAVVISPICGSACAALALIRAATRALGLIRLSPGSSERAAPVPHVLGPCPAEAVGAPRARGSSPGRPPRPGFLEKVAPPAGPRSNPAPDSPQTAYPVPPTHGTSTSGRQGGDEQGGCGQGSPWQLGEGAEQRARCPNSSCGLGEGARRWRGLSAAPSCRYMITSLDRTHAGFYRCIVRNRMGALLQRQTEVQVACK